MSYLSTKIGVVFLATGIAALSSSILLNSQILALLGLGLTFWGALFILVAPVRYVEGSLLADTTLSTYLIVDRIIGDFKYSGTACCLPPYSHEHLPENLKGLNEYVVFVSFNEDVKMASVGDVAGRKFFLGDRRGVLVTPPGLGLLARIEKAIFPKVNASLNDLCEVIPRIILENFNLAKDISMYAEAERVNLTIVDSVYITLYNPESNLKSISFLGCPIASAIACAIAKTSGKAVMIANTKHSAGDRTTEIEYRFIES